MPGDGSTGGGFLGCLISILLIMVFGATCGFIEWGTVGSFAKGIMGIIILGVVILGGIFIYTLLNKDK